MDEAELTRKAVEEIMREMQLEKEQNQLPQIQERKKNPLGPRPNKDFLGRTINSVMTHNKRQNDRNYRNCQRKLKDMDNVSRDDKKSKNKWEKYRVHRKGRRKRNLNNDEKHHGKKNEKKLRKKEKKKQKQKKSDSSDTSSSSSLSSSTSTSSTESISSRKKRRHKKYKKKNHNKETPEGAMYSELPTDQSDPNMGLYMNTPMAWAAAAMAYNHHMSQLLQSNCPVTEDFLRDELKEESEEEKVDIPSDLSLTYNSNDSEDLNISLNSSAEEDENGIVTLNLLSDEENKGNKNRRELPTNKRDLPNNKRLRRSKTNLLSSSSETSNGDNESIHSHISLESDISLDEAANVVHVSILSSSSSDSDCQEVKIQSKSDSSKDRITLDNEKKSGIADDSLHHAQRKEALEDVNETHSNKAGNIQGNSCPAKKANDVQNVAHINKTRNSNTSSSSDSDCQEIKIADVNTKTVGNTNEHKIALGSDGIVANAEEADPPNAQRGENIERITNVFEDGNDTHSNDVNRETIENSNDDRISLDIEAIEAKAQGVLQNPQRIDITNDVQDGNDRTESLQKENSPTQGLNEVISSTENPNVEMITGNIKENVNILMLKSEICVTSENEVNENPSSFTIENLPKIYDGDNKSENIEEDLKGCERFQLEQIDIPQSKIDQNKTNDKIPIANNENNICGTTINDSIGSIQETPSKNSIVNEIDEKENFEIVTENSANVTIQSNQSISENLTENNINVTMNENESKSMKIVDELFVDLTDD
ncbi:uncharacterized protein LOC142234329 isoform X2 [Haematobia irritans]|uniref:uncharacterized protein LOC142234329 isoform X2 n=1 Tax=Haematobia irritans TaxID=7368 RepID=UPI003F4F83B3